MITLNATTDFGSAPFHIEVGTECELLAMWMDQTLVVKNMKTRIKINQVPCSVFGGLTPDDIKFLVECKLDIN